MAELKTNQEVIRIRSRLTELEAERASPEASLTDLLQPSPPPIITEAATVPANTLTAASSAAKKTALFRSLFAGRTDVFPTRWENSKNGRSCAAISNSLPPMDSREQFARATPFLVTLVTAFDATHRV
jgi:hypothetical protein